MMVISSTWIHLRFSRDCSPPSRDSRNLATVIVASLVLVWPSQLPGYSKVAFCQMRPRNWCRYSRGFALRESDGVFKKTTSLSLALSLSLLKLALQHMACCSSFLFFVGNVILIDACIRFMAEWWKTEMYIYICIHIFMYLCSTCIKSESAGWLCSQLGWRLGYFEGVACVVWGYWVASVEVIPIIPRSCTSTLFYVFFWLDNHCLKAIEFPSVKSNKMLLEVVYICCRLLSFWKQDTAPKTSFLDQTQTQSHSLTHLLTHLPHFGETRSFRGKWEQEHVKDAKMPYGAETADKRQQRWGKDMLGGGRNRKGWRKVLPQLNSTPRANIALHAMDGNWIAIGPVQTSTDCNGHVKGGLMCRVRLSKFWVKRS